MLREISLNSNAPGIDYISFKVGDVDACVTRLREQGLEIELGPGESAVGLKDDHAAGSRRPSRLVSRPTARVDCLTPSDLCCDLAAPVSQPDCRLRSSRRARAHGKVLRHVSDFAHPYSNAGDISRQTVTPRGTQRIRIAISKRASAIC